MIHTLIALLFAHALADFIFQSGFMVRHKANFFVMLAHIAIVGGLSYAALGFNAIWAVAIVTSLHLLMDFIKTYFLPQKLWSYLLDQSIHLLVIIAVASQFADAYAGGVWGSRAFWESTPDWLTTIPESWLTALPLSMLLITGLVYATRAGGFAVGLFMQPLAPDNTAGIPQAGAIIGNLERGLAFLFILSGQPGNLGFLIAAKSVLRFGAASNDRAVSEYVIIGTLASFGWAFGVALITAALRGQLD